MAADGSVIIEIKGDYDEFLADLEKALKKAKERSKKSDDPLEKQRKSTQLTVKELQNLDSVASKALNGIIKGFARCRNCVRWSTCRDKQDRGRV